MKSLTLKVPQGIGDVFWIYQKLYNYCDELNFKVYYIHELNPLICRSEAWLKKWPKVNKVTFEKCTQMEYCRCISMYESIERVISGEFDEYSCNRPLEKGIRLEDIDPEHKVEWNIDLPTQEVDLEYDDFICLYVSGMTDEQYTGFDRWSVAQWLRFINMFKALTDIPIIMIGASYDRKVEERISEGRFPIYTDREPEEVLYILKKAQMFIGYQSGLNILADNFNTKQVMMYFPILAQMVGSWCQKQNYKTVYKPYLFSDSPEDIIRDLSCDF